MPAARRSRKRTGIPVPLVSTSRTYKTAHSQPAIGGNSPIRSPPTILSRAYEKLAVERKLCRVFRHVEQRKCSPSVGRGWAHITTSGSVCSVGGAARYTRPYRKVL